MATAYQPQPQADTAVRIAAYAAVFGLSDEYEVAMSLVDEDELRFPGGWESCGMDRNMAISEYLYEITAYKEAKI